MMLTIHSLTGSSFTGEPDGVVCSIINEAQSIDGHLIIFLNHNAIRTLLWTTVDGYTKHYSSSFSTNPETKTSTMVITFRNSSRIIFINQEE